MEDKSKEKQIYIVMSQTGTLLSRLLKVVTGAQYNHVSISLESDLHIMYSFGRRNAYNPFWAGFVMESSRMGTFKRFPKTEVLVLRLTIDDIKYQEIKMYLESMYEEKYKYRYNFLGLLLAGFHICYRGKNQYYCSEFIKEILLRFDIAKDEQFEEITQPMHFLRLNNTRIIYCGKLKYY